MNLFEIFVKLTHMHIRGLWEETTATFTGRTRKATEMRRRKIVEANYNACFLFSSSVISFLHIVF